MGGEVGDHDRMIYTLQQELSRLEERVSTIEHELHDGPLQRVIAARMEVQTLLGTPELDHQLAERLEQLDQSLELAVDQVRSILHGRAIGTTELVDDLSSLCHEFSDPTFQVVLDGPGELGGLQPDLADAMLRIVRELIWNARKHSGAGQVTVQVRRGDGQLLVEVEDRGKGFNPDHVPEDSFGLCTAMQRARLHGISMELDAVPGEGTRITLRKQMS